MKEELPFELVCELMQKEAYLEVNEERKPVLYQVEGTNNIVNVAFEKNIFNHNIKVNFDKLLKVIKDYQIEYVIFRHEQKQLFIDIFSLTRALYSLNLVNAKKTEILLVESKTYPEKIKVLFNELFSTVKTIIRVCIYSYKIRNYVFYTLLIENESEVLSNSVLAKAKKLVDEFAQSNLFINVQVVNENNRKLLKRSQDIYVRNN